MKESAPLVDAIPIVAFNFIYIETLHLKVRVDSA